RRPLLLTAGVGALWSWDHYANASTFERNLRTLYTGAVISADYKLNFTPEKAGAIDAVHERGACQPGRESFSGGLYVKFGQAVAAVPVLPPQYQVFRALLDNAPAVPYEDVEAIFIAELGAPPSSFFTTFSRRPIASASIAQVHRATLPDGTSVAVKIQKPAIAKQIEWDLRVHRFVLLCFETLFDLPLRWSADYIDRHMRLETDFTNEARNAERAANHLKEEGLEEEVYVPKVYWDLTTKRVMTAEWIDGVSNHDASNGRSSENAQKIDSLGWSRKTIMTSLVSAFATQTFCSGFIHCDPHPGNILVRDHPLDAPRDPSRPSRRVPRPQICLLDHGLYIESSPTFTKNYALMWKSIFSNDTETLEAIAESWGIRDAQMLASSALQRPWRVGNAVHLGESAPITDVYENQVRMKERIRNFLYDTELLPRELIFLGRSMNLIRANNRLLGSPVNRINILANRAVSSLSR
ncbi:ABC1 family-domain-containing protein, partial [Blyttiomyces helicus]